MYPGIHAQTTPDKPAVIMAGPRFDGTVVTYAELEDRSRRLAQLWWAAGLRPGDHVAILAENFVREPMHPMDEAEAFAQLAQEEAKGVEAIAAEFGTSQSYVRQRMKLATLAEPVKAAFRQGTIDTATATTPPGMDGAASSPAPGLATVRTSWGRSVVASRERTVMPLLDCGISTNA